MSDAFSGACALPHLGVIRVAGDDATTFLQGQLTHDVALMQPHQARLAAWCSAKGRMLASFVVVRLAADELLLVCSRDLLPATLKRLSMFVLRAKVKLSDESQTYALYGLLGAAAAPLRALSVWEVKRVADAATAPLSVRLPDAAADAAWERALCIAPAGAPAPAADPISESVWLWSEVRSGVARVVAAVTDLFVPQMLNYESVDGIHFRKGCYPGQEVVARSQFRGAIKRRGFVVRAKTALQPGQELFDAADRSQPCGVVALAAAVPDVLSPQGAWDAIASLQTASAQSGASVVTADGSPVQLLSLPYALRTDI